MKSCSHTSLELLPERKKTVRCQHCHLTLAEDELQDGFCPECFATTGTRRYQFDEVKSSAAPVARYRCEDCGIVITSK